MKAITVEELDQALTLVKQFFPYAGESLKIWTSPFARNVYFFYDNYEISIDRDPEDPTKYRITVYRVLRMIPNYERIKEASDSDILWYLWSCGLIDDAEFEQLYREASEDEVLEYLKEVNEVYKPTKPEQVTCNGVQLWVKISVDVDDLDDRYKIVKLVVYCQHKDLQKALSTALQYAINYQLDL